MNIKKIKLKDMKPAKYNPRKNLKPEDVEYQQIKNSIDEFGFIQPIVWNERTGNIVSGHQRVNILIAEGYEEVDAVVVDFDEEKEKLANISMNKITGQWSVVKLRDVLEDLDEKFSLEKFGFHEEIKKKQDAQNSKGLEEMEIKAFEHWDYVVFVFDNSIDFLNIINEFDIKRVNAGYDGTRKIGIGRVIKGEELVKRLGLEDSDN